MYWFNKCKAKCVGLKNNQLYLATVTLIQGLNMLKFLTYITKSVSLSFGISVSEPSRVNPEITWLRFESIEHWNAFVKSVNNLDKNIHKINLPSKETFIYGNPDKPNELDFTLEQQREWFNYEEKLYDK